MQIVLNGKRHELADKTTVSGLLTALNMVGRRVAVEINGEIIPRSSHSTHYLQANDKVEIIHAVGGG
ncbi:MAG TPA: sulfur carrier protein ThiS [Gammaproteobacteria bacterium]|nr:sulfur carrier protein ThiS [Gammaproteobacteria bacterium]